jgi:hypothetical protein
MRAAWSIRLEAFVFSFSKTFRFPSKYTDFDLADFLVTAIIINIHRAIAIFTGFFSAAPLPTPEK